MPTAKKTKSGSYSVSVYDYKDANGKQHYKRFTAPTKREAEALANQYKAGRMHSSDLLTVDKAVAEYIQLKTPVLSPATTKKYKDILRMLNKHYPALMSRKINSLKKNDIQWLISDLSLTKSPKTVKNYYGLLTATSDQIKAFKVALPKIIDYDPYIPTEEEISTLFEYAKGKEIEIPMHLAAKCMMRRGEICGLTLDDINVKNNTINIRHNMIQDENRNWIIKSPKTPKSKRIIKVPKYIIDMIMEKGYITIYNPETVTDMFEDALENLDINHMRFHDLRHYCASVFHYLGIPMSYTQKYGGWSTLNTLIKIYQHTLPDKEDEFYNKVIDYFSIIS